MPDMTFDELDVADERWGAILDSTDHDIYQLPAYVALEAKRMGGRPAAALIAWKSGSLLVPYVVRAIDGEAGAGDLSSPYGYAGYLVRGDPGIATLLGAVRFLLAALRERGYCSLFLRLHPILNDADVGFPAEVMHVTGATVTVDLQRPWESLLQDVRKSERYQARRLTRSGCEACFEAHASDLDEYYAIYLDTMQRVGASEDYYQFDRDYFRELSLLLGRRLTLCTVRQGASVLSAKLYTESSGIVENLLGGTYTHAVRQQPSVLETVEAIRHFKAKGAKVLHLGGGLGGQHDSLFHFKSSFSRDEREFRTIRAVLDRERYDNLVATRAAAMGIDAMTLLDRHYFPAYRTPPHAA